MTVRIDNSGVDKFGEAFPVIFAILVILMLVVIAANFILRTKDDSKEAIRRKVKILEKQSNAGAEWYIVECENGERLRLRNFQGYKVFITVGDEGILDIRDLRDLEIAARRIERLYQEEKKDYEQVLDSLENGKFMSEIEEPIFGVLMGCGVCFLMGYFCNWLKKLVALQLWNYCFFGVAIFFWFMGIVFLFAVISGVLENSRKRDEAQKNNAREEKRIADNQELINQVKSNWKKKETYIQSEYRKVYELKKNYYDQIL